MKRLKPSKKAKDFRTMFVQKWGSYTNETLVIVGFKRDDIVKRLSVGGKAPSISVQREFYDWVMEKADIFAKDLNSLGFFSSSQGASLLWLKAWDGTWESSAVLVHELHHAINDILVVGKDMNGEVEALAYQQDYLYQEIIKKLEKKRRS